jgi:hypothetical protein
MTGKTRGIVLSVVMALLGLLMAVSAQAGPPTQQGPVDRPAGPAAAIGSAFTYQGELERGGVPISDTCTMDFRLYDHASSGSQVAGPITLTVPINDGLFAVRLDFPHAFIGDARWLGIRVGCPGDVAFTDMGRQELTPAPYALALPGLWTEQNGTSPNLIGGYSGNSVSGGVVGATIGGGGNSGDLNLATGDYGTVGGGSGNTADSGHATVGGGADNLASGPYAIVGGGLSNTADGSRATISGGYDNWAGGDFTFVGGGESNSATGSYATVGGGLANGAEAIYATVGGGAENAATGDYGAVCGGSNNNAAGDHANVGGGYLNAATAPTSTIGGGEHNSVAGRASVIAGGWYNSADGSYAAVGGGVGNSADGFEYATVGGGYNNTAGWSNATVAGGANNEASGSASTVGGGWGNTASGFDATVAGGGSNTASGTSQGYATVGGGSGNTASGDYATVGGGEINTAGGNSSTVAGGWMNSAGGHMATTGGGGNNSASADYATVPGGNQNVASGSYSFAAGYRAKADDTGAFVWGDSQSYDLYSPGDDTFVVRAGGGIWFGADSAPIMPVGRFINTTTGGYLTTGGAWTDSSDRNLKENYAAVEPQEVLARVAELPITTWSYKAEAPSVRHMGPVAQDFYAAFGLGQDDTHIASLDTGGVALAAIQGLHGQNQALREENATLHAQMDDLEARIAALERGGAPSVAQSQLPLAILLLGGLLVGGALLVQRCRIGGAR